MLMRRPSGKNLVQLLLNEPTPQEFDKESMIDYIRRLMLRLTGQNLLGSISMESTLLKQVFNETSAALGRAQIIGVLKDYFKCRYLDGPLIKVPDSKPIPIRTLTDLKTLLPKYPKGYFMLVNNIDASSTATDNGGAGWNPIGVRTDPLGSDCGWQGFFNGNNKTISGLTVNRPSQNHCGLFGFLGDGAVIRDLNMVDTTVVGYNDVGSIAGQSFATIIKCTSDNCNISSPSIDEGEDDIGGLVGDNDGWIDDCWSSGKVEGMFDVGGLAGDNDSIITNSHSSCNVVGSERGDVGGLVGDNKGFKVGVPDIERAERGVIFNCYATGNVTTSLKIGTAANASGDVGGLAGDNKGGSITFSYSTGTVTAYQPAIGGLAGDSKPGDNELGYVKKSVISNCYSTSTIIYLGNPLKEGELAGSVGGLVGDNDDAQIFNCYFAGRVLNGGGAGRKNKGDFVGDNDNGNVSGCYYDCNDIGYSAGGIRVTTAALKVKATFVGWEFKPDPDSDEGIWLMNPGEMPTLPSNLAFPNGEIIDVYPIQRIGSEPLTSKVIPKLIPGHRILVTKASNDVVYTPTVVYSGIGRFDLRDYFGDDFAGDGLSWSKKDKLQINQGHGLDINENNELVVDESELNISGGGHTPDELTIGLDNARDYLADYEYSKNQCSYYSGVNYISLEDNNIGNQPDVSPTYWEALPDKVLSIENRIAGDGLRWSDKYKLRVNQGNGLDINELGEVEVDITEVYDIEVEDTIKEDGTLYADNDWHTVLEEQVTAEIGDNLDIRLFLPVRAVDIGIGDKRGKFSCRCCIGTLGEIGSTIVEGKYELPDHGDQIPVVMCITRKNIDVQNPYIRIQLRNDDYTVQQIRIDCADRDGQFSIIKF